MSRWLQQRSRAVAASCATIPGARDWRLAAACYAVFLAAALPVGLASGLLRVDPVSAPLAAFAAAAAVAFLHPAFVEEIVFRVLLLPGPGHGWTRARLLAVSLTALAIFVAAHPLNAVLFWPAAYNVFTNGWYLTLAGMLGATCTATYLLTRSVWPGVVIHWITVLIWLWLLGGQRLLESLPAG